MLRPPRHLYARGRGLLLGVPVSAFPSLSRLDALPSFQSKLRSLYKSLYRIRRLVDDKPHSQQNYTNMLRRRFVFENHNLRRERFLQEAAPLSQQQLLERLVNTYLFIHNSTCKVVDSPPSSLHWEELPKNDPVRIEKSILRTILQMEYQLPKAVKYDFSYKWLDAVEEIVQNTTSPAKKDFSRDPQAPNILWIGYRDYHITLVHLNESYGLCL